MGKHIKLWVFTLKPSQPSFSKHTHTQIFPPLCLNHSIIYYDFTVIIIENKTK